MTKMGTYTTNKSYQETMAEVKTLNILHHNVLAWNPRKYANRGSLKSHQMIMCKTSITDNFQVATPLGTRTPWTKGMFQLNKLKYCNPKHTGLNGTVRRQGWNRKNRGNIVLKG